MDKKESLRILLLQIRDTENVRREEHESFARYSGLKQDQIDILNVFDTPSFNVHSIDDYDALFVGGASEASVSEPETYPFVHDCIELLKYSLDISKPVFASCFGFQLAVLALGGKIIKDANNFEMGTLPITLSSAANDDIIFHDTPNNFYAVSVHKEKTIKAPSNCTELAYTTECSHSFKVDNKPFWAFQFHPEVDKATLVTRLTHFKDTYTENNEHLAEVLENAVETPESNNLLYKFVDRVLTKAVAKN